MASAIQAPAQEWVLGLGYADFSNVKSEDQGMLDLEVHAIPFYERGRFQAGWAGAVSVHFNGDFFIGAGMSGMLALKGGWFLEGSVMPGYYHPSTPLNDLGSDFEIRSLMGVGYTLKSGDRLSLAFTHKSNGGTSSVNPGVNAVEVRLRKQF
ncbi:MAG: lipid A 3-O-deacylase [Rhodobacteraceae bacterium]|nr:MAG: lipid A 3-O-deacylase [Paracoccaceae bacterium]